MTMRLHIMSDLHLEFGQMPRSYKPPECDVVILAGDICTGVVGVMWAQDTFQVPVLYVPGNHEYYGKRRYFRHLEKMKAKAEGSHVSVLNNDSVVDAGNIRFLGSTMWTDFGLYGTEHLSELAAQREMNDYRLIRYDHSRPLRASDTRRFHLESRYWLSEKLREPFDGKTVVITHHAPSERSIAPKWRNDSLSPAYASRLENLMAYYSPALWVHGHTHSNVDYELCGTRVICNPRGYEGHGENTGFDPQLVVEV